MRARRTLSARGSVRSSRTCSILLLDIVSQSATTSLKFPNGQTMNVKGDRGASMCEIIDCKSLCRMCNYYCQVNNLSSFGDKPIINLSRRVSHPDDHCQHDERIDWYELKYHVSPSAVRAAPADGRTAHQRRPVVRPRRRLCWNCGGLGLTHGAPRHEGRPVPRRPSLGAMEGAGARSGACSSSRHVRRS